MESAMTGLPPGAIPTEPIYSKEPQCQKCFHYLSEHLEGINHCTRTIAIIPDPDMTKLQMGNPSLHLIHPRIKCDCKHFVEKVIQ